jgi:5S rRNA maturation endonuclease (ribonuclease M5)
VPLPNGDGHAWQPQPKKQQAAQPTAKREITATYDYTDAQGELVYQVVRLEWIEDGERRKTFRQRRPDPEKPNEWIWNLEGVKHGLYRLPDLREAGADEIVFLPEGEKDVETLIGFGLAATTNSGGAQNWRPDHAEQLRGRDVVVLVDADDPGRERGKTIVTSLHGIAKRVRVLDFSHRDVWPEAPKGADVTDWVKAREGTAEDLAAIVETLPDAKPAPFVSRFGGIMFEQLDDPGPEYAYLVDDTITVGDKSIIGGASRSGKSFLAIHMGMCIAIGKPFFGRKILTPGLVIYQAGEGGRGIKKRFRAWRQEFAKDIPKGQRVPIYILQSKVDIYAAEGDTAKLIAEIEGISRLYGMPVIALFIDTLQKAQGHADENSGKDMGMVMANVDRIAAAMPGCHVCLVHHMNAGGTKLRGHTSVYAGIDQVILVSKDEDSKVRTALLDKQKDDEDGSEIRFELPQVVIGHRAVDGKKITSCVCLPASGPPAAPSAAPKGPRLTHERTVILQALRTAIEDYGEPPPPTLQLPRSITRVVNAQQWKKVYLEKCSDPDALDNTINKRLRYASEQFQNLNLIGRTNPWVWLSGKPVNEDPFTGSQMEFPEDIR